MDSIVYLNGEFLPAADARVSIFDRGFLFGDGVYEVVPVVSGVVIDRDYFLQRLLRSTSAVDLGWPVNDAELLVIVQELIARNAVEEGYVYLQITRGVAERDFFYPADTPPTLMAFSSRRPILDNPLAASGVDVVTVDDLRWKRRDIKSLNLLAQCMAKQQARLAGAFEAWMVEDGMVTEGASSSAFIVRQGRIVTRPLNNTILPGIRRRVILELLQAGSIPVEQRPFSVVEAREADEAFISSATTLVLPVVSLDHRPVGDGLPGPVTRQVRELYVQAIRQAVAASR